MTFDDTLRDCFSFGTVYKDSLHSACLRSRVATLSRSLLGWTSIPQLSLYGLCLSVKAHFC